MRPTKVDSSYIQSLQYDSGSYELLVRFRNGAVLRYSQIHPRTYKAILDADSHGEAFSRLMTDKKYVVIKAA